MSLRLETDRLVIRHFEQSDAKMVHVLAGSEEVARTTLSIPHPYPEGAAEQWIESTLRAAEKGESYTFAIVKKEDEELMGCMSLLVSKIHKRAELGYWFGHPYWGQGFATEAARRIVAFGFEELGLNRIFAMAMTKNTASYKVMRKVGMKHEGTFPQHVRKWGSFEDIEVYGVTRADYKRTCKLTPNESPMQSGSLERYDPCSQAVTFLCKHDHAMTGDPKKRSQESKRRIERREVVKQSEITKC